MTMRSKLHSMYFYNHFFSVSNTQIIFSCICVSSKAKQQRSMTKQQAKKAPAEAKSTAYKCSIFISV
jgi:hypothetical protein